MLMITPNSLARYKEEVQGEGEEEAGNQRKVGETGTPTSCVNGGMGFYTTSNKCYPLAIGKEVATKG